MGKKKTGAMPTSAPKQKKKMVIDMTKVELAKAYQAPGFRTGKHMTAKDRPRKKEWKREYEKEKGSQYRAGISFSIKFPEKSLKRMQETDKINMYRRGCISLASMPLNDFI